MMTKQADIVVNTPPGPHIHVLEGAEVSPNWKNLLLHNGSMHFIMPFSYGSKPKAMMPFDDFNVIQRFKLIQHMMNDMSKHDWVIPFLDGIRYEANAPLPMIK